MQGFTPDSLVLIYLLNFNGLFTAPIEYQNYYQKDATEDRNGSAGFVGGVMKKSELHNRNDQINDDENNDYYYVMFFFLPSTFPNL